MSDSLRAESIKCPNKSPIKFSVSSVRDFNLLVQPNENTNKRESKKALEHAFQYIQRDAVMENNSIFLTNNRGWHRS